MKIPEEKMFKVDKAQIESVIHPYGIQDKILSVEELLRYNFSETEVRLILKVSFENRKPIVVKFKNESDLDMNVVEQQSAFADLLVSEGIPAAKPFQNQGRYVMEVSACGYQVFVTVEEFRDGEISEVNLQTAYKTGEMLAKTHNISERNNCHVDAPVLFDPFKRNDLFFVDVFEEKMRKELEGGNRECADRIMVRYHEHMKHLFPLKTEKKYAVQGDISNNNLFFADNGEIGLFDFNRCGDNHLFCDAIMQAVFEARLMDYPKEDPPKEQELLQAFLCGYHSERPFSTKEIAMIPHLYAIISAFWGADLLFDEENALRCLIEKGDAIGVTQKLQSIEKQVQVELNLDYLK